MKLGHRSRDLVKILIIHKCHYVSLLKSTLEVLCIDKPYSVHHILTISYNIPKVYDIKIIKCGIMGSFKSVKTVLYRTYRVEVNVLSI